MPIREGFHHHHHPLPMHHRTSCPTPAQQPTGKREIVCEAQIENQEAAQNTSVCEREREKERKRQRVCGTQAIGGCRFPETFKLARHFFSTYTSIRFDEFSVRSKSIKKKQIVGFGHAHPFAERRGEKGNDRLLMSFDVDALRY